MMMMEFTMKRLYRTATVPYPAEFREGKRYKVIALPGVPRLPFHHKYFEKIDGNNEVYAKIVGYNKSIIRWGDLVVEEGQGCVKFVYRHWGIVDYVKRIQEGFYIGKYSRDGDFRGYFLLARED